MKGTGNGDVDRDDYELYLQRRNGGDGGTDYAPRADAKSPPVALHVESSESYELSFRGGGGRANDNDNDDAGATKSLYPSARRLSPGAAPDGGGEHNNSTAEAPRPRRSDAKKAPPVPAPTNRASAGTGSSSQQGKRSSGASRQEAAPSRGGNRGHEAAPSRSSTRASSASRASRRGGERKDGPGGGKRASSASASARASARSPPPDAKVNPETTTAARAGRVRGSSPGLSPESNKSGSGGVSSPGSDAPLLEDRRGSGGQRRSHQHQQRGEAQAAVESNNSYEVSYNDADGGVAIARSAESPPKSGGEDESSPRSRERKAKARRRRGSDDAQPGGPVKESSPHRHRSGDGRRSGGGRRGKSGSSSPDGVDRRARRERLARASRVHAETAVPATVDGGEAAGGGVAANGVGMSRGDLSKLLTLCEDAVAALQEEREQKARNTRRSTFAASSDAAAIARAAAAAVAAASIEQSATQSTSGTGGTTSAATSPRGRMSIAAAAAREEAAAAAAVWDDMHRWFADHPSPADRHDAVMNHHGEYGVTPLHVLCRHGDPPLEVITLVLASAPQATERRDTFGWLPLHYACASGCPEDVLAALVLHGPESTRAQDRRGRTPLHFALGSGQRKQNRGTRRSFGGGAGAAGAEAGRSGSISGATGAGGGTDEAAAAAASAATAAAVAWEGEGLSPTAVSILSDHGASARCDENRMLPLHYACAYGSLSEESLSALIRSNPDATTAVDKHGRTPLHFAMGNADKNASPHTCRALLDHDLALTAKMINMFDKEGQLPLHLLAIQAKRHDRGMISGGGGEDGGSGGSGGGGKGGGPGKGGMKGGPGGGGGGRKISSSISDEAAKYLDAENNARSCLGLYLDASPLPSADFLTALQSLPQWLRDYAVTSQHVQHVLNEKISQRFPTAILFLDFYVLITIIVCFRIASKSCIDYRFSGDGTDYVNHCGGPLLIVLYACATYFFLREVVQALSLWSLGSFQMWMADPKNWLDVVTFAAVYFFTAAMQIGFVSDDVLRTGTAVTTGLLWGSMISFLKSTLVDFAVFVDGVVFVLKRLAAFLLALSVIIVAFAMMFSTVFAWTPMCEEYPEYSYEPIPGYDTLPVEDFPFCTMTGSLMKCFTMLVGEVDEQIFTTTISKFLYALYAFLVVLLLFNVLIAIVIDSYGVIKNERAAMVFWSNRLDFVAEMDAISYYYDCRDHDVKQKETMMAMGGAGYAESTTSSVGSGGGSSAGGGANTLDRKAWDLLLSLFEDQDLDKTSFEFMFYLFLRTVVALVAIPLWLLLGLATAGVLWPPQVREWLLVQKTTEEFKTEDQHHTHQNFYEVNTIKVDVRKFKAGVKSQMRADREEVISFRTEAESFSSGMMSELTQVSEIMRSILDMRRSALAAAKKKKKKTKKQKQQQQGGSVSLSSRTSNEESRVARAGSRGTPTNARRGHTGTSSTAGYDI